MRVVSLIVILRRDEDEAVPVQWEVLSRSLLRSVRPPPAPQDSEGDDIEEQRGRLLAALELEVRDFVESYVQVLTLRNRKHSVDARGFEPSDVVGALSIDAEAHDHLIIAPGSAMPERIRQGLRRRALERTEALQNGLRVPPWVLHVVVGGLVALTLLSAL